MDHPPPPPPPPPLPLSPLPPPPTPNCLTIDDFWKYFNNAVNTVYGERPKANINDNNNYLKFVTWMKSDYSLYLNDYTYDYPYPVLIVQDILDQIFSEKDTQLCAESIDIINTKIQGHRPIIDGLLRRLGLRNLKQLKTGGSKTRKRSRKYFKKSKSKKSKSKSKSKHKHKSKSKTKRRQKK